MMRKRVLHAGSSSTGSLHQSVVHDASAVLELPRHHDVLQVGKSCWVALCSLHVPTRLAKFKWALARAASSSPGRRADPSTSTKCFFCSKTALQKNQTSNCRPGSRSHGPEASKTSFETGSCPQSICVGALLSPNVVNSVGAWGGGREASAGNPAHQNVRLARAMESKRN